MTAPFRSRASSQAELGDCALVSHRFQVGHRCVSRDPRLVATLKGAVKRVSGFTTVPSALADQSITEEKVLVGAVGRFQSVFHEQKDDALSYQGPTEMLITPAKSEPDVGATAPVEPLGNC